MKITELLKKESIALDVKVDSKGAAVDYLVDLMDKSGRLNDKEGYKKGILAREALGSTAVGDGIAIPQRLPRSMNLVWQPWWCRRAWTMNHLTEALPIFCS